MVSKVLFLVLVGCAFVLAKPIDENTEVAEVEQPQVQIVELSEEEAKKIFENVEQKFKDLWGKILNPYSHESFENIFDEVKDIFQKVFDEHKAQKESAESVESVTSHELVEPQKPVEETHESVEPQKPVEEPHKSVEPHQTTEAQQ